MKMDEYLGLSDEAQAACDSRPELSYDEEGGPDGLGGDAAPVWTLCEFCEGLIAPDDGCVEC